MLDKEFVARVVAALGAAHARIAAAMYAVDTHAAWPLLRGQLVTGATRQRGKAVQAEVDRLWACFTLVGEQMERARTLAAVRRPDARAVAELTGLLTEPIVDLDASGLPIVGVAGAAPTGGGGEPGAGGPMTLEALSRWTEQRCAQVLAQLSDVDTRRNAVAGEYVRVSADFDALATLATEVGEPDAAAPARELAEEIERVDLYDPLTAAPAGVLGSDTRDRLARLRETVTQARRDLADLVAARERYPVRRTELTALVESVASAEAGTRQCNARVREKIVEPGLADDPDAAPGLRERLLGLDALYAGSSWRTLATSLSIVEADARTALARAGDLTSFAEGLLARRDELRGRLTAYRAKAIALGHAEEPALTVLHATASDLLFTAPCDLRGATRAVHAYARALAEENR